MIWGYRIWKRGRARDCRRLEGVRGCFRFNRGGKDGRKGMNGKDVGEDGSIKLLISLGY